MLFGYSNYQLQYFLLTARVLFGEYGSGKTQVLIEKVRQTAWEMHFKKIKSIIYLFSFADVEVKNIFFEMIIFVMCDDRKVES